jgi:hypothetical protein
MPGRFASPTTSGLSLPQNLLRLTSKTRCAEKSTDAAMNPSKNSTRSSRRDRAVTRPPDSDAIPNVGVQRSDEDVPNRFEPAATESILAAHRAAAPGKVRGSGRAKNAEGRQTTRSQHHLSPQSHCRRDGKPSTWRSDGLTVPRCNPTVLPDVGSVTMMSIKTNDAVTGVVPTP